MGSVLCIRECGTLALGTVGMWVLYMFMGNILGKVLVFIMFREVMYSIGFSFFFTLIVEL